MAITLDDVTLELMESNSKLETISKNSELKLEFDNLLIDTIKDQTTRLIDFLIESRAPSLAEIEAQREAKMGQGLGAPGVGAGAAGAQAGSAIGGASSSGGGLLGGIGKLLGGGGLGGGALLAGLGILAGGGGYLLKQLQDMDAKKIVQNVKDLLSIGDAFKGGNWGFLLEGGPFALAMTGIGIGLIAFGAGQGVVAAAEYFSNDGWAKRVKQNVITLLSIADEIEMGSVGLLFKGSTFGLAMTGIGIGLAVFGAGSAVAGLADGLNRFINADGWAQRIKDNVITLMSISGELGGAASFIGGSVTFLAAMTGIAAGLAVFGAGSAVAGVGAGLADGIAKFTGESNFAQLIKERVKTLLSIKDDLGGAASFIGDGAVFLGVMTGIAAGLAVFGAGSAIAGVGAGLADAIAKFSGREGDFAVKIKDQVATLISITDTLSDGDGTTSKAGMFAAGMAKIAVGLAAFGGGNLVGTLANVGVAIAGFFGVGNPFDQIMQIADKADNLEKGANAIEKIAKALTVFGNIKISDIDIDFEDLALNLGRAVPFIDALVNGGEVKGSGGWFSSPIKFDKGILDPSLRLDEAGKAIEKLNYVLGIGKKPKEPMVEKVDKPNAVSKYDELSTEDLILKAQKEANQSARERAMNNNSISNSVINNSSSTTVVKPAPSPARKPNSPSEIIWDGQPNGA